MTARTATSPWSPALAPGLTCARCGTVTPYDETRVVGTLHLHSWQTCDCAVRGKHILTIQRSGPAFPAALLPAVSLSTLAEQRAYFRAWNRRANRAEAVNAAGAEHVVSGGAVMCLRGPLSLRERIGLVEAKRDWLNGAVADFHYMHRPIHPKASPFGWRVTFDGLETCPVDDKPYGFIIFASVHFTKLKGEFGYPGLPSKWQVLSLSRLWLHSGMPHNSETCVMGKAHKLVQRRWLEVHPPIDLSEPYHVVKILSFADNEYHVGTIYKAANYRATGTTKSKRRHKNSRGPGMDGHTLTRYIYDLPEPRWQYVPAQPALFAFAAP